MQGNTNQTTTLTGTNANGVPKANPGVKYICGGKK